MTEETSPDRDDAGKFLPGNKIWLASSSAGRNPKFKTPDSLWAACVEYFEWVHANPLYEAKAFSNGTKVSLPKMRAMSLQAMCEFIGISRQRWGQIRDSKAAFLSVITRVEDILYSQKFEGAAADLLNANIIARDLGLADKTDNKNHNTVSGEVTVIERVFVDAS